MSGPGSISKKSNIATMEQPRGTRGIQDPRYSNAAKGYRNPKFDVVHFSVSRVLQQYLRFSEYSEGLSKGVGRSMLSGTLHCHSSELGELDVIKEGLSKP